MSNQDRLEFVQTRCVIDGVPGGAADFHDDFLEKVRSCFTQAEGEKFLRGGMLTIKYLSHVSENIMEALRTGRQTSVDGDTLTIEVAVQDQLVALLYERRTIFNHAEIVYFVNRDKIMQQKLKVLSMAHDYSELPYRLHMVDEISPADFEKMVGIMEDNDLSRYEIDIADFLAIKDDYNNIVGFGRIYNIGKGQKELSSLWVDPEQRGAKIGLHLSKKLIETKKGHDELYLATTKELLQYYEKLGFHMIDTDIPEKFSQTAEWAKSQGIECIVMKYM